jgi:chromosome segregation ATPase
MPHATTPRPPSLRRRVADVRALVVGTKGLRAKVATHTAALKSLRARVDDHQQRFARQEERLKDLQKGLKDLQARVAYLDRARTMESSERERRDAQFGTIEVRLADLEQRLRDARGHIDGTRVDREALDEAGSLVEDVRTEHARIRARMQVVSAYEERLRRVEESVAELYEGDPRHLV